MARNLSACEVFCPIDSLQHAAALATLALSTVGSEFMSEEDWSSADLQHPADLAVCARRCRRRRCPRRPMRTGEQHMMMRAHWMTLWQRSCGSKGASTERCATCTPAWRMNCMHLQSIAMLEPSHGCHTCSHLLNSEDADVLLSDLLSECPLHSVTDAGK